MCGAKCPCGENKPRGSSSWPGRSTGSHFSAVTDAGSPGGRAPSGVGAGVASHACTFGQSTNHTSVTRNLSRISLMSTVPCQVSHSQLSRPGKADTTVLEIPAFAFMQHLQCVWRDSGAH